jgi:hypothetical protein
VGAAAELLGRGGNGGFVDDADPAAAGCGSASPDLSPKTSDPQKPSKTPAQANVPAMAGPFSAGMLTPSLFIKPALNIASRLCFQATDVSRIHRSGARTDGASRRVIQVFFRPSMADRRCAC